MKKSKYSESQVFGILREQELGKSVIEICRNHGITQGTFYRWKSKYSGMESSDIQKMRDLESKILGLRNFMPKDV